MEFRVLGPLQVVGRNAIPIDLPSVSQRTRETTNAPTRRQVRDCF
jgi:hypothetical protein